MSQDPSRREFVALSAAVGLAAAAGRPAAAASHAIADVHETAVSIKTADGTCDAMFYSLSKGRHPGVLFWSDAFGLRPTTRAMGRRLAAAGYSVLVPNPFYRISKAPQFDDVASFDFGKAEDRARIQPLMASAGAPGHAERDAEAYVRFLDSHPHVDVHRKIGTQGYCMGGPLVLRTAAALAGRVGAGASFHGGGLVTDKPDSPHLLLPRIKAQLYIAIAANDDERQPDAKSTLRSACDAAQVRAEIEVYPQAQHGWCMADMPKPEGKPIYNEADAERAWGKLLALYQAALV